MPLCFLIDLPIFVSTAVAIPLHVSSFAELDPCRLKYVALSKTFTGLSVFWNYMQASVCDGDIASLEHLHAEGVDVIERDNYGNTAIIVAAIHGHRIPYR
jgi:hypothetical protein